MKQINILVQYSIIFKKCFPYDIIVFSLNENIYLSNYKLQFLYQ